MKLVFGYGTMRSDCPHGSVPDGRSLGFGWTQGELWRVKNKFGTWAGVRSGLGRVYGEVFEVNETVLARLDQRERISEGFYARATSPVFVAGCRIPLTAEVYFAGRRSKPVERIKTGDWVAELGGVSKAPRYQIAKRLFEIHAGASASDRAWDEMTDAIRTGWLRLADNLPDNIIDLT
jgi:gamma-glutamylcyclotransferase (GGCT)/AIG2-like uncharacterized protein YtfP